MGRPGANVTFHFPLILCQAASLPCSDEINGFLRDEASCAEGVFQWFSHLHLGAQAKQATHKFTQDVNKCIA